MRILCLDLDTLRPDHLGCYGYSRNTSPNIDKIAAQGVCFTNCYCSDAPCLPSRAATMTGRFGIHSGIVGHGGTAADMRLEGADRSFTDRLRWESLPAVLRSAGFKTVTISPFAERHSAWWFYAGFNEMYNTGQSGMESAEAITPAALSWISKNAAEDNWFLHVNYWDAHTPYRAPESFKNPFSADPIPTWLTEEVFSEHHAMVGPHSAKELNMYDDKTDPGFPRYPGRLDSLADVKRMIDGYDCGIRYMDSHIGLLLEALSNQGVDFDSLAIIVCADHGENLGELGIYGEHATADQATCRVPFIMKWPACKQRHFDHGLHYNLDLLPTLAELLEQKSSPRWDGQSFASTILAGADSGRPYLVLGQCAHVCQRSVRFGPWLYLRTYHDGYHLFPDEMLFNLNEDPYEQRNLAKQEQNLCCQAVYHLNQWHDEMMRTMETPIDPLWTVMKEGGPFHTKGQLRAYLHYLQHTGRRYAVSELIRRHPEELG
ncbi:MAG: sulfatase [Clostridia bacterium]|nr:sulfatase [Clostridia bacterium]